MKKKDLLISFLILIIVLLIVLLIVKIKKATILQVALNFYKK